jgi:hypothetical protein
MALRYAVANGNWSNTATWNGGTLPTSADDVYTNNFTVTIDQNVTVLSLRNTAGAPAVAGGIFILTNGITINATGTGLVNNSGLTTLIDFQLNSPNSATINSTNMSGTGGNANTTNAIVRLSSTGTLTVNSNWLVNNAVICISGNGTFNLNGSGGHISTITTQPGIRIIAASATLNWVGNLTFVGSNTWSYISDNGNGVTSAINIIGNIKGSETQTAGGISTNGITNIIGNVSPAPTSASGPAIFGGAGAVVTVNGIISSNSNRVLAISSTGLTTISGQVICVNESPFPVQSTRLRLSNSLNTQMTFQTDVSGVNKTLYEPGTALGNPAVTDVRNGTTYASGALTGTLDVPPASSVAVGVPVDNTVGTAIISITDMGALLASYNV